MNTCNPAGDTGPTEIAQRTALSNDAALRDKVTRLIELGYLEIRQNIDAKPNEEATF